MILATHGYSQRDAARMLNVSRSTLRDHLTAAARTLELGDDLT